MAVAQRRVQGERIFSLGLFLYIRYAYIGISQYSEIIVLSIETGNTMGRYRGISLHHLDNARSNSTGILSVAQIHPFASENFDRKKIIYCCPIKNRIIFISPSHTIAYVIFHEQGLVIRIIKSSLQHPELIPAGRGPAPPEQQSPTQQRLGEIPASKPTSSLTKRYAH